MCRENRDFTTKEYKKQSFTKIQICLCCKQKVVCSESQSQRYCNNCKEFITALREKYRQKNCGYRSGLTTAQKRNKELREIIKKLKKELS